MKKRKTGENLSREWSEETQGPELWDALDLLKSDAPAAVDILREMAESGSPLAMLYLGAVHLNGKHGVPKDADLGEMFLRRSSEAGSIEAGYGLGWYFEQSGRPDAALKEYERLADRGSAPAFFIVGMHHHKGMVVERNRAKALKYFLSGEAKGHFYAASWAYRILILGENGLWSRFYGLAKFLALLPPFVKTQWTYPNSDRLRLWSWTHRNGG